MKPDGDCLDDLRRKLDEAGGEAGHPMAPVARRRRLQLILVRATFNGGDLDSGRRLAAALQRAIDDTARRGGPTVTWAWLATSSVGSPSNRVSPPG